MQNQTRWLPPSCGSQATQPVSPFQIPKLRRSMKFKGQLCRNHGFLNIFSIQCNCWKCFAQSCPKGLSEAQQMCWQEMLRKCSHDMRRKCGENDQENDRLTTESCSDQNYDNPNCRKGWHMVFLCSQVVAAWMPSSLIHMSIIAGSGRIVHLIAGILCALNKYVMSRLTIYPLVIANIAMKNGSL